MMYDGYGGGWWMALSTVVFWGLIITAVVLLVRYLARPQPPTAVRPTAEQILAERFARGDIDVDEYAQRRQALRAGTGAVRS